MGLSPAGDYSDLRKFRIKARMQPSKTREEIHRLNSKKFINLRKINVLKFYEEFLPSPVSVKRKTGNAPTAKKTTSTPKKKKENPTSDALLLAFEDPAPAPITSPFSVDSPRASAFDHEPPADLPGFLSDSRVNVVSSRIVSVPLPFPDNDNVNYDDVFLNDNDDDVFLDVPMAEHAPKRTLRSSRSTDAKSSEAPVVKKKMKRE
ncbi:unnamed protein product [Bathycoccus prasinos]